jgi:hypothetical protein
MEIISVEVLAEAGTRFKITVGFSEMYLSFKIYGVTF